MKKRKCRKSDNSGFTLVEMVVSFALLALFTVAATRVISYTIGIYYAAKGNSEGLQVANIISNKVVGQIEGAGPAVNPKVGSDGSGIDSLLFIDATGSRVTISATPQGDGPENEKYINIHYDPVTEGSVKYEAVDWRFDSNAYMGYTVKGLTFEDPGDDYPDNVLRMTIVLHSGKYGDYSTSYYIKCINVDKIEFL